MIKESVAKHLPTLQNSCRKDLGKSDSIPFILSEIGFSILGVFLGKNSSSEESIDVLQKHSEHNESEEIPSQEKIEGLDQRIS